MAVLFDTLKLAQRLEAAGMLPEQAQGTAAALAEATAETVATRQDLQLAVSDLRGEIHEVEGRLRAEIATLRGEVRGWLMTQAFAIIGAVAAMIGLAAALSRLVR
ncbi:MAG: hypothetical protein ACREE4_14305 [Stellaceae bacterium]